MAFADPLLSPAFRESSLASFAPLSSRRLLVLAGIALILIGMIFGDVFAIFVLHQNASRVGASLAASAHAALAGDRSAVAANLQDVGAFLENRGTKVDTHVHLIGFGYLALLLAVIQPWIALTERARQRLAWMFIVGAGLLPVGVFLIHYVGLLYSPFSAIGWASVFADFGGLLVLLASLLYLAGLWKHFRSPQNLSASAEVLPDSSAPARALLVGGLLLVLLGFLHGSYYAAFDLYRHESADFTILSTIAQDALQSRSSAVDASLQSYGQLQGEKAVNIAAHSHAIEFGILAMLLAFLQPYVRLREAWKLRWAVILLVGSLLLPVCVLLELPFGLVAGGLADFGGLLVIVALLAMWIGVLRFTGALDAHSESLDAPR